MHRIKMSGLPLEHISVATSDTSKPLSGVGGLGVSITDNTSSKELQARYVVITVEDNPVRVALGWDNANELNTPATTSLGHLFQAGDTFRLEEQEIAIAEFISANAGSPATLQVTVEY